MDEVMRVVWLCDSLAEVEARQNRGGIVSRLTMAAGAITVT